MSFDLNGYKSFLSGVHDNLILDNDREMVKKARDIKASGHNMQENLLRQKIEELEQSIQNESTFKYTFPEEEQMKHLKIDLFESPISPRPSSKQ
jgi:gluconate kinase